MTARPLTARQAAFVREYLVDLNATAAVRRAGYATRTPDSEGVRLLARPAVAAAVAAAMAERARRTDITAARVLHELAALAFLDPADIARHPVAAPEDIANLPEAVRRAITGWSWDKDGRLVLKLSDKIGALTLLGRHLAMFSDKLAVTGADGGPVAITEIRRVIVDPKGPSEGA